MNLDDIAGMSKLDACNMLGEICSFPEQLRTGWKTGIETGFKSPVPIKSVIIAGMGGSAIGGDLAAAYVQDECKVPILVHRDYDLPAWANGSETLVIVSSHSGNTEETLSALKTAIDRKCTILAICTGGILEQVAQDNGISVWKFIHAGQPRSAVGFSFSLVLAALYKTNLISDQGKRIEKTAGFLNSELKKFLPDVPVTQNPAKRQAGQMMGRLILIIGSGAMSTVARRWKGQLNELAKGFGSFDALPEADHNTIAGVLQPDTQLDHLMVFFIRHPDEHPRNHLRGELTQKLLMEEGVNADQFTAKGEDLLQQMGSAILFGDFVFYYLALAYDMDPTPIQVIRKLKSSMG